MKRTIFLTLFSLLLLLGKSWAFEILVILSGEALPYELTRRAFTERLQLCLPTQGIKAIAENSIQSHTMTKGGNRSTVLQIIEEQHPDLVVAIGKKALQMAALGSSPVVYLLVPNAQSILPVGHQATGVTLEHDGGSEFSAILKILPNLKKVGVVYDPKRTEPLILRTVAARPDLTFILRPIKTSKEVAAQLETLKNKIDLLWMVPDITAVSPQTEQSYYSFSLEQQIPLFSFSTRHLSHGATLATVIDWKEIGEKGAELALQILAGVPVADVHPVQPDNVQIKINTTTAQKINLHYIPSPR